MLTEQQEQDLASASKRAARRATFGVIVIVLSLLVVAFRLHQSRSTIQTEQSRVAQEKAKVTAQQSQIAIKAEENKSLTGLLNGTLQAVEEQPRNQTPTAAGVLNRALENDPNLARVVPRIYLHIRNPGQRQRALAVATSLRSAGFLVPGVDAASYSDTPPAGTELHYYTEDAVNARDVQQILSLLNELHVHAASTKVALPPRAGYRAYGLWLGEDFSL